MTAQLRAPLKVSSNHSHRLSRRLSRASGRPQSLQHDTRIVHEPHLACSERGAIVETHLYSDKAITLLGRCSALGK